MTSISGMLSGGHHNSLGRTDEVAEMVLADPSLIGELFNCYRGNDELVRLRTSSAFKRIQAANPALIVPMYDDFIEIVAPLDQASAQWTLAILFDVGHSDMTADQQAKALAILKRNLEHHDDWIVLNYTMTALAHRASEDQTLRRWLEPHLEKMTGDRRKSVSKRAQKSLTFLRNENR